MYGFALETAIKATIIQDKPDRVEFQMSTNANHDINNASLKGFGVKNWHDLSRLAEVADLFKRDFANGSDRNWLDHFTDAIVWRSRYPVPKQTGEEENRDTLYAIRNAENWLQELHPEPLEKDPCCRDPSPLENGSMLPVLS
jgi:hypothetical protein